LDEGKQANRKEEGEGDDETESPECVKRVPLESKGFEVEDAVVVGGLDHAEQHFHKADQQSQELEDDINEEVGVVVNSNTIIDPRTVVIEAFDTAVTNRTVS